MSLPVPAPLPFPISHCARLAAGSGDFLELHLAVDLDELHERLWTLLTRQLRLHSCSLYLNYLGDDREFQVLHRQVASGHPLPWAMRRQLSPARGFLRGNVGIRLYRLENLMPDRDRLEGSPYFRQVMQAEGWGALLSLCVWDEDRPKTVLTMRRSMGRGNFSADEIEWVEALQPHFEVAFRRTQAVQRKQRSLEQAASLLDQLSAGVVLLAPDRSVAFRTPRAERICLEWNALEGNDTRALCDAERLPAAVLKAVEELECDAVAASDTAPPANVCQHAGEIRITGPGDLRASVQRTWMEREPRRVQGTLIVLESAQGGSPVAAQRIGLAGEPLESVLSRREYVVARLVAAGMTNEEIATRLYKSVNTIKSQVASALRKLKLARRVDLVRLWLDQPVDPCTTNRYGRDRPLRILLPATDRAIPYIGP